MCHATQSFQPKNLRCSVIFCYQCLCGCSCALDAELPCVIMLVGEPCHFILLMQGRYATLLYGHKTLRHVPWFTTF